MFLKDIISDSKYTLIQASKKKGQQIVSAIQNLK